MRKESLSYFFAFKMRPFHTFIPTGRDHTSTPCRMSSPPSQYLVQALRGQNGAWRYLLVIFVSGILCAVLLPALITELGFGLVHPTFPRLLAPASELMGLALSLFSLLWLTEKLHKRPWQSLFRGSLKVDGNRLVYGLVVSLGLFFGIGMLASLFSFDQPMLMFWKKEEQIVDWFRLIFLLPMHAGLWGIFLVGYFLQGLIQRFKTPWLALFVHSLIWTVIFIAYFLLQSRFSPGYAQEVNFPWETLLALLAIGCLIILDEGVELAIAFLFSYRVYSLVVQEQTMVQRLSQQEGYAYQLSEVFSPSHGLGFVLVLLAFLFLMYRHYSWKGFSSFFVPILPDVLMGYEMIEEIGKEEGRG
jgi:hypothetical protein